VGNKKNERQPRGQVDVEGPLIHRLAQILGPVGAKLARSRLEFHVQILNVKSDWARESTVGRKGGGEERNFISRRKRQLRRVFVLGGSMAAKRGGAVGEKIAGLRKAFDQEEKLRRDATFFLGCRADRRWGI